MIDLVIDPRDPELEPLGPTESSYRAVKVTVSPSRVVRLAAGGFLWDGAPVVRSMTSPDPIVVSVPATDGAEIHVDDRSTFTYTVKVEADPPGHGQGRGVRTVSFTGMLPASLGATVQVTALSAAEPLPVPYTSVGALLADVTAAKNDAASSASAASTSATSAANAAALVGAPAKAAMDAAMGGDVSGLVLSVQARARLTAPSGTATANRATLQAAMSEAATAGAPLLVRGAFAVSGPAVDIPAGATLDLTHSTITQTDNLRALLTAAAGATVIGGTLVGKGTDWVNTSAVYAAAGINVLGDNVTVRGVKVSGVAGAGVYSAAARAGLKVLDCDLTGVGSGVIPAGTGQFSAGVLLNANGSSGVTVRGGSIGGFAQGVSTGSVSDIHIGGGVRVSSAGQHAIYLGSVASGAISDVLINGAAMEGIKAQVSDASPFDTDGLAIGNVVMTGVGSNGVNITNTEGTPSHKSRRVVIHDVTVKHSVAGNGNDVNLIDLAGATVHDVRGFNGFRGLYGLRCSDLNVHDVTINSSTRSPFVFADVTDSTIHDNTSHGCGTDANAADRFGVYVTGATSARLKFSNNVVDGVGGGLEYLMYIAAGDYSSMSFLGNSGSGATAYGFRMGATVATALWVANDLQGATARFFNIPTNAAAIADTSGAALASLEAEVNKLKARMRSFGAVT